MNVSVFILSDNILTGKRPCPNKVEILAVKKGFFITKKLTLPSFYPELETLLDTDKKALNIIICEKNKARVNEAIASVTSDILRENSNLKNAVLKFYKEINIPFEKNAISEWEIPSKARGIINEGSANQGYFITGEKGAFIVLSLDNYFDMLEVVLDAIENKDMTVTTFKTFGLKEENIKELLIEKLRNKDGIKINTFSDGLDVDVTIKAKQDNEKLEEYTSFVLKKLSKFVYAEEQISLFNVVFDLLVLTSKKLAIAEGITGGNITASLTKFNQDADKILEECLVAYTDKTKHSLLNVSEITLKSKTATSSEVAYEMAQGLLNATNADIVLATAGDASGAKAGECYIAIGDREKINVYKNIFSGTKEEIITSATKSSLFYLVKKIRSNDFVFNQTGV